MYRKCSFWQTHISIVPIYRQSADGVSVCMPIYAYKKAVLSQGKVRCRKLYLTPIPPRISEWSHWIGASLPPDNEDPRLFFVQLFSKIQNFMTKVYQRQRQTDERLKNSITALRRASRSNNSRRGCYYLSHCYSIAWDRLWDRWRLSVCLSDIAPVVAILNRIWWNFAQSFGVGKCSLGDKIR